MGKTNKTFTIMQAGIPFHTQPDVLKPCDLVYFVNTKLTVHKSLLHILCVGEQCNSFNIINTGVNYFISGSVLGIFAVANVPNREYNYY